MRLTFLGGADEVGASSLLVEIAGRRLLVDAGIRISPRTSRGIQNDQLPDLRPISDAGGPDYILLTHAHTDHTGALPLVVEQYPHVPVLATPPTIELTRVLQADGQRLMQARHEAEGELPLYDEVAVQRLLDAFQPVAFRQPLRLGEGLQVTYFPAGHILGAATLLVESSEGTLALSGDLSRADQRAVVAAQPPGAKADVLVLESTYGGKLHANRVAEERRLIETLDRVVQRGGRVLIPAFAIGRAQEVLQILLAFSDRIDVPVYVDGMVRSVCTAYARFPDWLPPGSISAAGDDHLFFRGRVKAVQSALQREEIARGANPAIIVASSGMLTGGASVVYARHLAEDERSAILLTGYQDEEAPGRFLQRLQQDRQAGQEAALRLDGQPVTVRCEVDTYSLSAHADEGELVSLAEALDADDVLLVHGDPPARTSLAAALRRRERRVRLPQIGQTHEFTFSRRLWAIGVTQAGSHSAPLAAAALWETLKASAGSFYSDRELARLWWGDEARAQEARTILAGSPVYFAQDWRRSDTFRVRTAEQVARSQRQRAILQGCPDLVGQLVVLYDRSRNPRLGLVVNASEDSIEAVVRNAKGRHYPADVLLWPLGRYDGPPDDRGLPGKLNTLYRAARAALNTLLPPAQRQALAQAGEPIRPEALLPASLPGDLSPQAALLAVVLALGDDGAQLLPGEGGFEGWRLTLGSVARQGPLEQNLAREVAVTAFPAQARLRRVGMEVDRRLLTLFFDFPDRAAEQYTEQIARLEEQTGWDVLVSDSINQQALAEALQECLPPGGQISKGPSFHLDRKLVEVQLDGVDDPAALAAAYHDLTGFALYVRNAAAPGAVLPAAPDPAGGAEPQGEHMEINAAYALIREALEPLGLYRTSLKQGAIVLSFISPQVGQRHQQTFVRLAEQTGYPLSIHPHPNQQQILAVAGRLIREAGWAARKGPGIHTDRGEVVVKLAAGLDAGQVAAVTAAFEAETGYRLVVEA